jgi:hypothetical protein
MPKDPILCHKPKVLNGLLLKPLGGKKAVVPKENTARKWKSKL